ncbi:tRNA (adenosine(37)-N6)-threonylcarbamoyltransferase complex transferase subunit TsaD [Candidatus Gottesmanbacteria bacterium RIFCSPLOWO2_02_FULL_42_29]|uniref:tRNA N6-adenosine threonylcarbamoyltransferase n=2 Tax=Candidatus Gottesmaniibacteriota TaxID=1752720 RepID=A0A1F6B7U9_9BACT|nr:MAG: putative tRNA threonylcarbamoyladenosine biosynthesis protein Gcp [Candidatus Gottesmanbacteria bacterium GW2011_GWA2_42_18]OGG11007.1 MAG: tRNA (adenosine(37)-N6)-threonylcarbamoyltransferase complex transferase subunit TsaD [Candidatus Gottesmanbacteria bacterium RIFCSPHIGHO2_01_FULL_42_27]OGG22671.1 MAG: tRNA (adenosine(37)-N6)-threonylcarbamoyltransferase complex transferase subunit TsaD [Candidatus Gottesmanbacteria bacterium RIFCSPHIGHO2_12_FULL_43_26]OGG32968.1 MAG: tRNA (adenosin
MLILGIETSCDETAAAVICDGREILSNIVSSSASLHEKYGGIIPEKAAREQVKCIVPVIDEALRFADTNLEKIDAIAVTVGPGLIGSLLVGVEAAKTLSLVSNIPLIPVNHVLAHLYANFLTEDKPPAFPCLGLVVSGGHTELYLLKNHQEISWLGGTLDDAAGEAFDKTARLLKLGFPGGPAIAAEAAKVKRSLPASRQENIKGKIRLPRPMIGNSNLNFSFSGLKTAVLREVQKAEKEGMMAKRKTELAFEIEEAITDVLIKKTLDAAERHQVKSIIIGGGVAANKRLTEKFKFKIQSRLYRDKIELHIPPPSLCTDNAAYIASYAFFRDKQVSWQKVEAQPGLDAETTAI